MPTRPPIHRPGPPRAAATPRPSSSARGYNWRWRKRSKQYLLENPLCAPCKRLGVLTAATIVDHVIPHRGNMELFWDESNWQSACKPCHDHKTATEDGGFGNPSVEDD
jgi:5-methylcytosine-specific restriction protein A